MSNRAHKWTLSWEGTLSLQNHTAEHLIARQVGPSEIQKQQLLQLKAAKGAVAKCEDALVEAGKNAAAMIERAADNLAKARMTVADLERRVVT